MPFALHSLPRSALASASSPAGRRRARPGTSLAACGAALAAFALAPAALAQAPSPRPESPAALAPRPESPAALALRPEPPAALARRPEPPAALAPRPEPPAALARRPEAARGALAAPGPAAAPASRAPASGPGADAADARAPAAPPRPRPRAYGSPSEDDVNFAVPATRRGGFLVGVMLGGQLTGARGTPTDYDERTAADRVSTGAALGATGALFLGGALTDWFAFKIGYQQGSATKGDYDVASSGLLIGVESWPLFALGGPWRDLGLLVDFGTGGAAIERRSDGKELANAGAYSLVRAGVAWDALRLWKLNVGPALAFEHTSSETYRQNTVWLGLRTVFYGAP